MDTNPTKRLEELRTELRAERISYGELLELQSLAKYIDPGDTELLEAAGVPEHVMSMKSGAQYVKEAGCCPRCDSDQIEGGSIDVEGPVAWQRISCTACGLDYQDTYTLSGYLVQNGAGFNEYNATPLGRPITDAQRDTILAALRLWQATVGNQVSIIERKGALPVGWVDRMEWIQSLATDSGKHPLLNPEQIEELCAVVNHIPGDTNRDPAIIVFVKGGMVEETIANFPVRLVVVDQDTDGSDDQEVIDLPNGGRAGVTTWYCTEAPEKVEEYDRLSQDND